MKPLYFFALAVLVIGTFFLWPKNQKPSQTKVEKDSTPPSALSTRTKLSTRIPTKKTSRPQNRVRYGKFTIHKEGEISEGRLRELRKSFLIFKWAAPGDSVSQEPITTFGEAKSALTYFLTYPRISLSNFSLYEDKDHFLAWGTHTTEPNRGYAFRKHDGRMMTWDLESKTQWRRDDIVDNQEEMFVQIIGYFYPREEWEFKEKIRFARPRENRKLLEEEYKHWKENNPTLTISVPQVSR